MRNAFLMNFCVASLMAFQGVAYAQAPNLSASWNRPGLSLDGDWAYSIDPYRTGALDFHGHVPGANAQRYRDINVASKLASDPKALFEFDMDHAPKMTVPGAWNSAVPELRYYDGLMWFQRHFTAEALNGRRAFLRFEAVNYQAKIYLNGALAGTHEGGFTPFVVEVTSALKPGDNQVTLGVDSKHDIASLPPPITDWDLYGGVTRSVRLIYTPATFVDQMKIGLGDDGRVHMRARLNGDARREQVVRFQIGSMTVSGRTDDKGEITVSAPLKRGIKLWSPDDPVLYPVTVSTATDRLEDRVGLRTIAVKGSQILLNGKPIFLRGISMHEEEIGENPARIMTEAASRNLMSLIKGDLHGNFVRLAHYPHSEVTLRLADEMGLLVWGEIPVYWTVDFENPRTLDLAKTMMAEMIDRDENRASLALISIGNETPLSDPRNAFMREMAHFAKSKAPDRLIVAALLASRATEAGQDTIRITDPLAADLDVLAVNTYNGWYSDDELSHLPDIHWATGGAKPLILSEFGADAKAGFHVTGQPTKFSEDYQRDYYIETLKMADRITGLAGMSPWILKDFRSPRRQHPIYQQGWNRKGLISETGQRKAAFDVLADYYARLPVKNHSSRETRK